MQYAGIIQNLTRFRGVFAPNFKHRTDLSSIGDETYLPNSDNSCFILPLRRFREGSAFKRWSRPS
jgi:hypothetical protein